MVQEVGSLRDAGKGASGRKEGGAEKKGHEEGDVHNICNIRCSRRCRLYSLENGSLKKEALREKEDR